MCLKILTQNWILEKCSTFFFSSNWSVQEYLIKKILKILKRWLSISVFVVVTILEFGTQVSFEFFRARLGRDPFAITFARSAGVTTARKDFDFDLRAYA